MILEIFLGCILDGSGEVLPDNMEILPDNIEILPDNIEISSEWTQKYPQNELRNILRMNSEISSEWTQKYPQNELRIYREPSMNNQETIHEQPRI